MAKQQPGNKPRFFSAAASPSLAGLTFRSVELKHASPDEILSVERSEDSAAAGMLRKPFPVIYSSTRPGTAIEEAFQLASDYELLPEDLKPRITSGIEWDLARVMDFTRSKVRAWLKPTKWMQEDFSCINDSGFETLCQAFGRAARNSMCRASICERT